jgi:cobalt-precorrin 5A hydrolase/precorrin-3B C17-methyltransferase
MDKWHKPPVLAVAEDGSAVVPLLGGLHGVNDLARQIAAELQVAPAITTTGDIRFRTALLSPPAGYHLANPDHAKTFIADLLAGASVRLEAEGPWLQESKPPITPNGRLTIQVTERAVIPTQDCLVYHPATVAIGMCQCREVERGGEGGDTEEPLTWVRHLLAQADIAPAAVAGLFALDAEAGDPVVHAVAQSLNIPAHFFTYADMAPGLQQPVVSVGNHASTSTAAAIALAAAEQEGRLIPTPASPPSLPYAYALALAPRPLDPNTIRPPAKVGERCQK